MAVSDQFVLCEAALIFAVTRWILSFFLNLLTSSTIISPSSDSQNRSCCSSSDNLKMLRNNLTLTTLKNIEHMLPESHDDSCAVCLNKLKKKSQVWELRNCNHVFHKNCLERWMAYDDKVTCPLCRSSLVNVSDLRQVSQPQQPSWAVERMLYLFGDDLLP